MALSQQLLEQFNDLHLVFIGAPNERAYTEKITKQLNNDRVHNTAGDTNIDQVIDIIQHIQFKCSHWKGGQMKFSRVMKRKKNYLQNWQIACINLSIVIHLLHSFYF